MRLLFSSVILMGFALFFRTLTRPVCREVERRDEEKGQQAEERPETSPSSPNENESAEFDVFLSFHGKDTRKGFTGHLYQNLTLRRVETFIDSENLRKGERIEQLLSKIEASNIFLPVFSKGYANSKWCLKELEKALQCRKKILPVFFDVGPSDLKGGGSYALAFRRHKENKKLDQKEVERWRAACKEVASISGHHLQNHAAGHEAKLIQFIIKDVMTSVGTALLDVAEHPVGLESRVEEIKEMLDLEAADVRMIGIYGMGGMGKTTLAKKVYNEISRNFDGCSFVYNVRETSGTSRGVESLQTQMIRDISGQIDEQGITDWSGGTRKLKRTASRNKVLIVVDDINHRNELKALVGDRDWFGKGSRIIITTRDKRVLIGHGIEEGNMYALGRLNDDHSMELFCYHAFRSKQPPDECYRKLAYEVVSTTEGLPLALEVLGSEFFDAKNPKEWKALIRKLREYQNEEVHERLRISYDHLDFCEKQVFLDIACFFLLGDDQENPILMWEACGFHPSVTIKVLLHKSLIKMREDGSFGMHDQIRDMARNIILQESRSIVHPGRRSRFGNATSEQLQTLEAPMSVLGISFKWDTTAVILWEKYTQLRYLEAYGVRFEGSYQPFPTSLKWLSLNGCKFEQPPSHFDIGENIVILELRLCRNFPRVFVEQSFVGRRGKAFGKLKVLDLTCTDITRTPDFTNVPCPNLERLILKECEELTEIHESVGELKRLVILDLKHCYKFSILPNTLGCMASLKELVLDYTKMETLPDSLGELTNLRELHLNGCHKLSSLPNTLGDLSLLNVLQLDCTSIETLPDSIGELAYLCMFSLRHCKHLKVLPHSFRRLCSLKSLDIFRTGLKGLKDDHGIQSLMDADDFELSSCELLYVLPNHFLCKKLRRLCLDDPTVEALPESMGQWGNLRALSLHCKKLKALPESICSLHSLNELHVSQCDGLSSLPLLPASLTRLTVVDCISLGMISAFSHLISLTQINLGGCCLLKDIPDIENSDDIPFAEGSLETTRKELDQLKVLDLSQTSITATPDFNNLPCPCLEKLILRNCGDLKMIHESMKELKQLLLLDLTGCHQLSIFPDNTLSSLSSLVELVLDRTDIETVPDSIGELTNLRMLSLDGCEKLSSLPNTLGSMASLEKLAIDCSSLEMVPSSIEALLNLSELYLVCCDQPHFIRKLRSPKSNDNYGIQLNGLNDLHGICDLMNVVGLHLSCCELLYVLPDYYWRRRIRRLQLVDPEVETLPESLGQVGNLVELSLVCKKLKALPDSIGNLHSLLNFVLSDCDGLSSLPLLPPSLVELSIFDCTNIETMSSTSHLTSLTRLCLSGCWSLKEAPGLENISNNLEDLILWNLNGDFLKTVLQEFTFDALCTFDLQGGISFVRPGVGRQHRLSFMLPKHNPFTSCKEVAVELLFNGELVNDDEQAHWTAHVDVLVDDGLTAIASMLPYTFLPGHTIAFRESNAVMQALHSGNCGIMHVSLELPEEPMWLVAALNLNIQR